MDSGTIEGDGRLQDEGEVDPHVTLAPEELSQADFSSAVLSKLAQQGLDSTRYQVKGEVARGGMGAVLRVWDEGLRRHLAMKVMLGQGVAAEHGDTPSVDPRSLARFLEEAQVTGQLDHPGIVPVHELGLDAEGRVYFTMKLVKGRTLRQVFDELEQGKWGWTQTRVLGLIQKVCDAMSYAHAKGVIHRDLKPANVMVGKFGEVYVMDWGLARILGRDDERDIRPRVEQPAMLTSEVRSARQDRSGSTPDMSLMTMDGDVVGTPAYMPPEQARGDLPGMGPHSDVYAVGAMLYHLLAGQMPYVPRDARLNNYAVWQRVQEGPPRPLHEVAPHVPAELAAICERAMAREASQRYADMAALADDLSAYVEGRVVQAYETGAWAETRKWVRRNNALALSLAGVVALLVVGLVSTSWLKAESDAKTAQVLRLSDVKVLQELLEEADELWPAHPEKIPELEGWIQRARALIAKVPVHRETLAALRGRALPPSAADLELDRESHPRRRELLSSRNELEGVRRAHAIRRGEARPGSEVPDSVVLPKLPGAAAGLARAWSNPGKAPDHGGAALELARYAVSQSEESADFHKILAWALFANGRFEEALAAGDQALELAAEPQKEQYASELEHLQQSIDGTHDLERKIAELEGEVSEQRTWRFTTRGDQWQHDLLQDLLAGVEDLEARLLAEDSISEQRGWSVPRRLAFARELDAGFAPGGPLELAWREALPAIREGYGGSELPPQMGLLPLGPDPDSGLWEFAHLMTGDPPERDADGKLVLTAETCAVLVLLPGGHFWMGAQSTDPDGQNYDPQARGDEGPVHEVELSPFFLSKYELTARQWLRAAGQYPTNAGGDPLPVARVSWRDCLRVCGWLGLSLPKEAQWEYGARGGTTSIWWTGNEEKSLDGAANLSDRQARDSPWQGMYSYMLEARHLPWLDDGSAFRAPVGSYEPNPFGLHDVHGNVDEWCLDGYDNRYHVEQTRKDPAVVVRPDFPGLRVHRGGNFNYRTDLARSAWRGRNIPEETDIRIGVRPARAVEY